MHAARHRFSRVSVTEMRVATTQKWLRCCKQHNTWEIQTENALNNREKPETENRSSTNTSRTIDAFRIRSPHQKNLGLKTPKIDSAISSQSG